MIIGIDGQTLQGNPTEVGRYLSQLIEALSDVLEEDKAYVWMNNASPDDRARVIENRFIEVVETHYPWPALRMSWATLGTPTLETLVGRPVDVGIYPHYLALPQKRGARVIVVHDLTFLVDPEFSMPSAAKTLGKELPRHLPEASLVLTFSEYTKNQIVKFIPKVSPEKIHVIPRGLSEPFRRPAPSARIQDIKKQYGLNRPYFLHVGTLEPRKNLLRLVHAFLLFKQSFHADHQLLLVGARGWIGNEFMSFIQSPAITPNVQWIDRVPETDLPPLYSGADAFLFPSLKEGFGLPLLEAMGCGAPVICSSDGSNPEIVGEAAYQLDPTSVNVWAEAMGKITQDPSLADELRSRGLKRASHYDQETTVRSTLEALRQAVRFHE